MVTWKNGNGNDNEYLEYFLYDTMNMNLTDTSIILNNKFIQ